MLKFVYTITFFLGILSNIFSQELLGEDYLINTRRLTTEEGLSQNQVNVVYQDKNGMIWLGTQYGVNRYDGYEFKWFTKEKKGLADNAVNQIVEDDGGWLWVIRQGGGRYYPPLVSITFIHSQRLDIVSFQDHLPDVPFKLSDVKKLVPLKNYTLLFFLKDGRTLAYSTKTGFKETVFKGKKFRPIKGIESDTFWAQIDNNLIKTNLKGDIITSLPIQPNIDITDVVIDAKGRTWEVWMKRTNKKRNKTGALIKQGYLIDESQLYFRENGELFLAKEEIRPYFATKGQPQSMPLSYASSSLELYYYPELKQLWMKGGRFFQFLNKNLEPVYENEHFIEKVNQRGNLFFDKQNRIWVPTRNGVLIMEIKKNPFDKLLYTKEEKGNISTRGIGQIENMLMVNGGKNYAINLENDAIFNYPKIPNKANLYFPNFIDKENNYWTAGNQIHRVDVSTGNVLETLPPNDTINGRVFTLLKDSDETWWFNVWYRFLFFYNEKIHDKPQLFELYNGIDWKGAISWQLTEDRALNAIWMVSEKALYLIDKKKGFIAKYWNKGEGQHYLPASHYYCMYEDEDGIIWLGTSDGLLKVERKYLLEENLPQREQAIQLFTRLDGLPANKVFSIEEDEYNHLWLGTENGLVQFDKSTNTIRTFLPQHGVTHPEFNRLSSFKNKDGRMYFGGLNGVTAFYPKDFHQQAAYKIPLIISSAKALKSRNEKIEDITAEVFNTSKIVQNYRDKFLELKFSLQDYFYSDKVVYEYQIKNYKDEWTILQDNVIQIGKLPIGKYQLNVRAKGLDNRYSTSQLSIPIIAKAPFYLTWWFILLALMSIGFGLYQLYLYRTHQLIENKRELEKLVAQRTAQIEKDKKIIETQAQELQELDKVKSRFFANVSHELRTPLTLILSPINSMLNSKELSNKNFTYASVIKQNAKNLLKRINEILDLTKLDAKQLEVKNQPTSFYPFVKRLVATFESLAQQKGIQLVFDFQVDKSLQILLDQDKFEHIFNNFFSNALKYTPNEGEIEVIIKNHKTELQLSVKDTGQGIHVEDLPKIFDRFYQAKHTKSVSGTGIGLALCRELAQVMNGSVKAESTIDKGSTFYFNFPYKEILGVLNDKKESEEVEKIDVLTSLLVAENKPKMNKRTLLLVEDNTQLRNYIQLILEDDYHIITAENGRIALEKLPTANCELIISDIMMPEMDGFELLEHLKQNDKWQSIPVIMLTARASVQTKLDALRIGVDDYMVKPFEELVLKARIQNLLKNSQQRLQTQQEEIPEALQAKKTIKTQPINPKWLKEIEILILAEMTNRAFNLDFIAEKMVLSKRQLQRKIKQNSGLSANNYIRAIRLEKARRMLEQGELQTVSEASYAVGFEDPHYFSTIFEKEFGVKPKVLLE